MWLIELRTKPGNETRTSQVCLQNAIQNDQKLHIATVKGKMLQLSSLRSIEQLKDLFSVATCWHPCKKNERVRLVANAQINLNTAEYYRILS